MLLPESQISRTSTQPVPEIVVVLVDTVTGDGVSIEKATEGMALLIWESTLAERPLMWLRLADQFWAGSRVAKWEVQPDM